MPTYIEMPKLSDTMTEGTLVKWHRKVGDKIEIGDVVADVETDKATMEMEAFDEGTIHRILIAEGSKVGIGEKLAMLLEEDEEAPADEPDKAPAGKTGEASKDSDSKSAKAEESKKSKEEKPKKAEKEVGTEAAKPQPSSSAKGVRVFASPLAKKLAEEKGVALDKIEGSGPGGRIVAADITSDGPQTAPLSIPPSAPYIPKETTSGRSEKIQLSGMRMVIAERLLASKTQIPHFYLHSEVDAEPIIRLRKQLNEIPGGPSESGKITINDFILLATARAAALHPKINASFAGDSVIQYADVNLAVAVAVADGLLTPVIPAAQDMTLRQISEAVKDLSARARNKKLKPEEYQGGTITVTNLGAYGVERFAAIINPPQAAIVSVGAIMKKPVVNERDEIVAGQRMSVSVSCDHRVVDGAVGAEFMADVRRLLENPALMLF